MFIHNQLIDFQLYPLNIGYNNDGLLICLLNITDTYIKFNYNSSKICDWICKKGLICAIINI